MKIKAKIQKWGNSLALRLTGMMKTIPEFKENMQVDVEVSKTGIYVRPIKKPRRSKMPFTEAELLEGLDAKSAHANELATLNDKELGD